MQELVSKIKSSIEQDDFESITNWNTHKFNIDSEIVSSVIESNQIQVMLPAIMVYLLRME